MKKTHRHVKLFILTEFGVLRCNTVTESAHAVCSGSKPCIQMISIFLLQGIFIAFVHKNSPASMAGLRFGDQILQINNENVAGWDMDKCMKFLKKAAADRITMAIRDRYV